MKKLMRIFFEYTFRELEDWREDWWNGFEKDTNEEHLGSLHSFTDTLEELKIMDPKLEQGEVIEKVACEIADRIEDKIGVPLDKPEEFTVKNWFDFAIICYREYKKNHSKFYFVKKFGKMIILDLILSAIITMINPLTWFRFWKGYFEYLRYC